MSRNFIPHADSLRPGGVRKMEGVSRLLIGAHNPSGGVDDRAQAFLIKRAGHIGGAAALRAIAGHEEEGMRQRRPQLGKLRGIGRADNRADARIAVFPRESLSPRFTKIAHHAVDRLAAAVTILQLPGGGVGGFDQHEEAFILPLADV